MNLEKALGRNQWEVNGMTDPTAHAVQVKWSQPTASGSFSQTSELVSSLSYICMNSMSQIFAPMLLEQMCLRPLCCEKMNLTKR